jgi:hypothetical protein
MLSLYPRNLRVVTLLVGALMLLTGALACNLPLGPTVEPTSPPPPPPPPPPEPTQEVTGEPQPTSESPEAVPNVTYEGISFSYDDVLASDVTAETIPAVGPTEGSPEWEVVPEHVQVSFNGYILPDAFHEPRIYVYPVGEFEAINEIAGNTIAEQRQLLAERPAAPEEIPFLPMFNAAQMMRAQVEYLDFQSGTGVRFVTQYSQALTVVNNQELFYTFQGLTHDGAYYVAAILPVSNPILPADGSGIPGGDFDAFASGFENYIIDTEGQLDAQPPSGFTPDLSLLDAMIQSLKIE